MLAPQTAIGCRMRSGKPFQRHQKGALRVLCQNNSKLASVTNSPSWVLLGSAAAVSTSAGLLAASACLASPEHTSVLYDLAELDAAAAATATSILRPTFAIGMVLYVVRIVTSWYPQIDGSKLPWAICYAPTEPILQLTRKIVPLVGGVDVTPIVWVAIISFFNEILLGPQGLLIMVQRQGSL